MNVIAPLDFELSYYDVSVHYVSLHIRENPLKNTLCILISDDQLNDHQLLDLRHNYQHSQKFNIIQKNVEIEVLYQYIVKFENCKEIRTYFEIRKSQL